MSEDSNARSETPDIAAVAAVATEYFQSWFAGMVNGCVRCSIQRCPSAPLNTRAAPN